MAESWKFIPEMAKSWDASYNEALLDHILTDCMAIPANTVQVTTLVPLLTCRSAGHFKSTYELLI